MNLIVVKPKVMSLIRLFYSTKSFTIHNTTLFQTSNGTKHILMITKAVAQMLRKNAPFFESSIHVFMSTMDPLLFLFVLKGKYCMLDFNSLKHLYPLNSISYHLFICIESQHEPHSEHLQVIVQSRRFDSIKPADFS